ncbi:MAG: thioredoxin [Thermoplasmata archaeon]|nr:thioredoxin [Thermoplasmata archaeon]MCJ7562222.1 thioredoxin [Thermoplasmata archaeon]
MSSELEEIRQKKMQELIKTTSSTQSGGNGFPSAPVVVTDENFEETIKKYPNVVVDCWAPWCGPCRTLSPTIDAMAKDYTGKVVFTKLNTDENINVASKFRIMSIPTLLYFKNGSLVDKTVGALPRPMLESQLKKHLA